MQVDSDNGYMGDYNYHAYYPSFGCDLGMLEAMNADGYEACASAVVTLLDPLPREGNRSTAPVRKLDLNSRATPAPNIASPWVTPARSIKASIEASLHQAMKYKPTVTANKFAVLASLECEELQDVLQPPVACGPARVLQSPGAGSPVRRRERKRYQPPICKGF